MNVWNFQDHNRQLLACVVFLMDPFKQMIFQYITLSFSFNNRCRAFFLTVWQNRLTAND